ncbi:MAG TPA: hypothetical protein VFB07_12830 [Vicinamibacterales bacterium]|nr:hypothetical protein [Vicinamibacterales bacterium]
MHRMLRVLVIAFASVVLTAVQARAQSGPSADFAFGYVYMHDNDLDTGFPAGWMVSAAGHVTSWFSLVGEVGGSYKTVSGPPDVSLSLHTFSFGPRFGVTQRAPIAPFIQVLIGVAHGSVGVSGANVGVVFTGNDFLFQPGAGIDINGGGNVGLRLEGDVRGLQSNGSSHGEWRLVAALVLKR